VRERLQSPPSPLQSTPSHPAHPPAILATALQTATSPAATARSASRRRARIAAATSLSATTTAGSARKHTNARPLLLDRKLGHRRGELIALGGLVYLQDRKTEQRFLVDTGAAVSVFPDRSSAAPSGPPLTGADGRSILSWGSVKKTLNFGLRTFICSFILAAVSKPFGCRLSR
jgi:hypothetical protein